MCIVKLTSTVVVRYGIINLMLDADIPTTLSVQPTADALLLLQPMIDQALPANTEGCYMFISYILYVIVYFRKCYS